MPEDNVADEQVAEEWNDHHEGVGGRDDGRSQTRSLVIEAVWTAT